jgi:hypothetical protein
MWKMITTINPVKFFPGYFSFEKFMPYFSNANSFLLLPNPLNTTET